MVLQKHFVGGRNPFNQPGNIANRTRLASDEITVQHPKQLNYRSFFRRPKIGDLIENIFW